MLVLRKRTLLIPSVGDLAQQLPSLKVSALTAQVDRDDEVPALRTQLAFEAVLGEQRVGPLRADVVHVAGTTIGLHIEDQSRERLLGLLQGDRTDQGAAASDGSPTNPAEPQRQRTGHHRVPPTGAYGTIPPPSSDGGRAPTESARVEPMAGRVVGRVTLGVLPYLFDHSPVEPPGAKSSLVRLFTYLQQHSAEGTLTLRGGAYEKRVMLMRGTPLDVAVTPPKEDEQLGQILLKAKWLTPHKLADVMRVSRHRGVPIGHALVQGGVLDQHRLNKALAHQTYRRLSDLFSWDEAEYRFEPSASVAARNTHPVAVPRLLHELGRDLLRDALFDDMHLMLDAYLERFPRLALADNALRYLVPDARQAKVCQQIFKGDRTLRAAMTASILGRPETLRLATYLTVAGALRLAVDPPIGALSQDLALQERLRMLGVQDCFQRLGLPYTAHASDIGRAFERRSAPYRPGGEMAIAGPKMAAMAVALIKEAAETLSEFRTRRAHRETVLGPVKMRRLAELLDERASMAEIDGHAERATCLREVIYELT